jgi:hypothetical protein
MTTVLPIYRENGKVLSNQQARRPAVNKKMFGTFPIRYRQLMDASAFSHEVMGPALADP